MENFSFALNSDELIRIKNFLLDFVTRGTYSEAELAILPNMTELLIRFKDFCI